MNNATNLSSSRKPFLIPSYKAFFSNSVCLAVLTVALVSVLLGYLLKRLSHNILQSKKTVVGSPDAVNLRTNHKPVAYNDKSPIAAATRPHVPDQETAKTVTTNGTNGLCLHTTSLHPSTDTSEQILPCSSAWHSPQHVSLLYAQ